MAGIGFRLNKILAKQTLSSVIEAYGYAALISSGPWLLSISSLSMMGWWIGNFTAGTSTQIVYSVIGHVFCFSLILCGPFQLVTSRHSSDLHFRNMAEQVFPAYVTALSMVMPSGFLIGGGFFYIGLGENFLVQSPAVFLMVVVPGIWLLCTYHSAMKNYQRILLAFLAGYGASVGLATLFSAAGGGDYMLLGFAIGQGLLFLMLFYSFQREVGNKRFYSKELSRSFGKYRMLALSGLIYNLALWSDKLVFWWFSPERVKVAGWVYASPVYDQAAYISTLSIIPGMALFLLMLETDFASACERYFRRLIDKATLGELLQIKEEMIRSIVASLGQLMKVQGMISLLLLIYADSIFPMLGMSEIQAQVAKTLLLGSFLLVFFLCLMTVLFYLDRQLEVVLACALYLSGNVFTTLLSFAWDERLYGIGMIVGLSAAIIYSLYAVIDAINKLEYHIFSIQPLYAKWN